MAKYPCINCVAPKRHPGCHDHCQEYKDVKALEQSRKNPDKGGRDVDQYTTSNVMKYIDFNTKKRRSGRLTYSRKG